jgi:hypothetical protein
VLSKDARKYQKLRDRIEHTERGSELISQTTRLIAYGRDHQPIR